MKCNTFIILVFASFFIVGCRAEELPTPTEIVERPTITITPTASYTPQIEAADPVTTIRPTKTGIVETAVPNRPTSSPSPIPPTATDRPIPTPINTPVPSPTPLAALPTGNETLGPPTWVTIGTPLPFSSGSINQDNVNQLVEVGRWGKGAVLEAAYSPDGNYLITGHVDGSVRFWAVE